jgi:hypothetical protein
VAQGVGPEFIPQYCKAVNQWLKTVKMFKNNDRKTVWRIALSLYSEFCFWEVTLLYCPEVRQDKKVRWWGEFTLGKQFPKYFSNYLLHGYKFSDVESEKLNCVYSTYMPRKWSMYCILEGTCIKTGLEPKNTVVRGEGEGGGPAQLLALCILGKFFYHWTVSPAPT